MADDYRVKPRSAKDIAAIALAWRDALGVPDAWSPNVITLLEIDVPKLIPEFALVVRPDDEMGDAEAYTEFNPPHIAVCGSVYRMAQSEDGRSRMTFAHELGHLVMHPGAVKLRSSSALSDRQTKYFESAEWQARKFAALFLVPDHIAIQFDSADQLAAACHVSSQAAQIRFNETAQIRKPKSLPSSISEIIEELKAK
ncbi:ImmA/IrrE family metallo-endopeptidase [Bradyrhizobium manausense]|uniref:ImmA/IrrE family metallo-endopeptidase n=1 Tax=Bradyrhizobium manausense TaxID=989370 RepID=UPI001BADB931|nr:ImmA/IrrE family metallo-endopeptidase [Bradyrhizobium manausense]MBR0687162.1 ImmA/IrrE family metallo-endopeptidase [Bradyrhizobium manausense]